MEKKLYWILFALALLGVLDAGFLVFNEKTSTLPFCSINSSDDCSSVLESSYAYIGNLSVASIGLIHYSVLALTIIIMFFIDKNFWKYLAVVLSTIGLLASAYFMFIQLFILKNICLFCTISAVISLSLFLLIQYFLKKERKKLFIYICDLFYKLIIRPILFKIDSEKIHEALIALGEKIGSNKIVQKSFHYLTRYEDKALYQNILGIEFISPIGLAAGFDYDARLTQFLPTLNFGFGTCGTITNMPYEGNPRPRLARLIKSKSLLVNKGFKSAGADKITQSLKNLNFEIPIGISIGRTNSPKLQTQRQSVEDIISAFKKFENVNIKNAYYELNISCPNLIYGNISFYPLENLRELLEEIEKLKIKKPIFIKMPIDKSNEETLKMLQIASQYSSIKGVIFGNVQTNKNDPALYQDEVAQFKMGKFSGKPTFKRSNELIKLAYKNFGKRFIIVGCGGVFSAKDAYLKIKLGASLVQLITGLIFEGPHLISKINLQLIDLLKKDGFKNIKEAIGKETFKE